MNSKIVQEAINGMNDSANPTTEPGSTRSITEEDESYAKTTSENAMVKVLGSIWNTDTDQFTFDLVDLSQHASLLPTTKRSLLKISAIQELCIERTDWDDQLKGDHLKKWKSLILEPQTLNSVCMPRCYFDYTSGNLKELNFTVSVTLQKRLTLQVFMFAPFMRMDALMQNWLHRRLKSHR